MDVNSIINGTQTKALRNKFNEIRQNINRTNAYEYFTIYSQMPLSKILDNSEIIFCEPYKGLEFYKSIFQYAPIPLQRMMDEVIKVRNYVDNNITKMSIEQRVMYEELKNLVYSKFNDLKFSCSLSTSCTRNDVDYSLSEFIYNKIYECQRTSELSSIMGLELNPVIYDVSNTSSKLDVIYALLHLQSASDMLYRIVRGLYVPNPRSTEEYQSSRKIKEILVTMTKDKHIRDLLQHYGNDNLSIMIYDICNNEIVHNVGIAKVNDVVFPGTTAFAVNNIFDDEDRYELDKEDSIEQRVTILLDKQKKLEDESEYALFELLVADDETLDKAYDEALADLYVSESDIAYEKLENILLEYTEVMDELLLEFENGGKQPKIIAKEMGKHSDQEEEKHKKTNDRPSKEKPSVSVEKPEKPKQNMSSKIQEKKLDADKKSKIKKGKLNKFKKDVKTTAKTVIKVPENISNNINSQVKTWDDMDDEKRKKYIMEPGFRKKYFKLFRLALAHGIAFMINPLLNIVVFIVSKLSHEKDIRIRNELRTELETEIKICEEKINDATQKGDDKKKYQLMRIRDKLKVELSRITSNTRYI